MLACFCPPTTIKSLAIALSDHAILYYNTVEHMLSYAVSESATYY